MAKRQRDHRPRPTTLANLLLPVYDDRLEANLGDRLRDLRRQQGLSLRVLAEKSGLSANTLSLIENGKTSPSVSTLQQIAVALNIPITSFFDFKSSRTPVIYTQKSTRTATGFSQGAVEDLGKSSSVEGLQCYLVTINPHSESSGQTADQQGIEFIYCISGQIICSIFEDSYTLNPGDSIMFATRAPHSWSNPLDEPAVALATLAIAEDRRRVVTTSLF